MRLRCPLFVFLVLVSFSLSAQKDRWKDLERDADSLFSHEEYKKAGALYSKVIDHSGLKEKSDYQAVYKRSFCFYSAEQYQDALKDIDQVIANVPEMVRARILRAFIYKALGEVDHQISDLNFVMQSQPPRPDLLKWRASAYLEKASYDSAKQDLLNARMLADDDELEMYLGMAFYNTGQVDSALASLNRAIELNPTAVPPYLYATSFCLDDERFGLALKYIDVALSLEPKHGTALLYKGIALVESDRINEGCRCLTKAFAAGEDDAGAYLKEYCYSSSD